MPTKEQGPQNPEQNTPPKTIDEYLASIQLLENQQLPPREFLERFSEIDIKKIFPSLDAAIKLKPSDKEAFSILPQEEWDKMDENCCHSQLKFIVSHILKNTAILTGDYNDLEKVNGLLEKGSLDEYLIELMDAIWNNRGKGEQELKYPEREQGEKIEQTLAIVTKALKKILPWFNPQESFDSEILLPNLRRKIRDTTKFDTADRIYVSFNNLKEASTASQNVHAWHQALSYLTQKLDAEDFAILFSEAITDKFRHVGYMRKNEPDVIEWHKQLKKAVSEAVEKWLETTSRQEHKE